MTHTRHHPHTWQLIRDDYLAGQPRSLLAERYGVGESTIRDRAGREGWRRVDQPPADPPPETELDEVIDFEPMRSPVAVIADAYRYADLFMRRGRPIEARRYLAIARDFERLNRDDPLTRALYRHWADQARIDCEIEAARPPEDGEDPCDPPNPPNPPTLVDRPIAEVTEELLLATSPRPSAPDVSGETGPVQRRRAELQERLARRRARRLPFHDIVRELSSLQSTPGAGYAIPPQLDPSPRADGLPIRPPPC